MGFTDVNKATPAVPRAPSEVVKGTVLARVPTADTVTTDAEVKTAACSPSTPETHAVEAVAVTGTAMVVTEEAAWGDVSFINDADDKECDRANDDA